MYIRNCYLDEILPPGALREQFIDDVLSHLKERYIIIATDEEIQGEAISNLRKYMSAKGIWSACRDHQRWSNLPCLGDFESLVEYVGFRVVKAKNHRGNKARVVTL